MSVAQSSSQTRIVNPRRQTAVKCLWATAMIATTVFILASFFASVEIRMELCTAEPCNPLQVTTEQYAPFAALGIPVAVRVLFLPVLELLVWIVCAGLGVTIFLQRSDDWI